MPSIFTWPITTPLAAGTPETAAALGDAFGTDVYFDGRTRVTPKGDLQLVAGIENLRRAVFRRLITRPGEYRANPSYGVGLASYVKKRLTSTLLSELRHRIIEQLSQDRRVDRVVEVKLTPVLIGGMPGLRVGVVVQAIGRTLHLTPFDFKQEV